MRYHRRVLLLLGCFNRPQPDGSFYKTTPSSTNVYRSPNKAWTKEKLTSIAKLELQLIIHLQETRESTKYSIPHYDSSKSYLRVPFPAIFLDPLSEAQYGYAVNLFTLTALFYVGPLLYLRCLGRILLDFP